MTVVTRFAPSPTGYLHIGGARTALFNYLYSKKMGGKFLLRIEDTDRARSTDAAVEAILSGLRWLGLEWDGEEVYQFSRSARHAEVAHELVKMGKAYYCYEPKSAKDDIATYEITKSKWRDAGPEMVPPEGVDPVVRLKAPHEGVTIINDVVQGEVVFKNELMDDMILLRSDGTPTYMLAVVVDDHDMGVTHIIRGDDHLTNAGRQKLIYDALGWNCPSFTHIPLIHGEDGAKLSKRHGALGVEAYRDMGYLPETMLNYLLRLGWSHGNDEIISKQQAIEWFNLESIGKSPSRLDFKKLDNLNSHYIKEADPDYLIDNLKIFFNTAINDKIKNRLKKGLNGLKQRAKTLKEMAYNAEFYLCDAPLNYSSDMSDLFNSSIDKEIYIEVKDLLENFSEEWNHTELYNLLNNYAKTKDIKLAIISGALRIALTNSNISPSIFEIMEALGKEESIKRIKGLL